MCGRNPPDTTKRTWLTANFYAYDITVGGRDGWRLPTVEELKSLVDRTQSNPALPSGPSLYQCAVGLLLVVYYQC